MMPLYSGTLSVGAEGGNKMDKVVSAGLIAAIAVLISVNCVIIYNTWIVPSNGPQVVKAVNEEKESRYNLIFNNDTSINNDSQETLWIIVIIIYNDRYNAADYEVISSAADEGYWQKSDDGWYYYVMPLNSGMVTRPVIDRLLYGGHELEQGNTGRFRLQAEAVDAKWLSVIPDDGREAFKLYETGCSEQNREKSL